MPTDIFDQIAEQDSSAAGDIFDQVAAQPQPTVTRAQADREFDKLYPPSLATQMRNEVRRPKDTLQGTPAPKFPINPQEPLPVPDVTGAENVSAIQGSPAFRNTEAGRRVSEQAERIGKNTPFVVTKKDEFLPVSANVPVGQPARSNALGDVNDRFARDSKGRTIVAHGGKEGQAVTPEELASRREVVGEVMSPENVANAVYPGVGTTASGVKEFTEGRPALGTAKVLGGVGEALSPTIGPAALEAPVGVGIALAAGQAADAGVRKLAAERGWTPEQTEAASQAAQWLVPGLFSAVKMAGKYAPSAQEAKAHADLVNATTDHVLKTVGIKDPDIMQYNAARQYAEQVVGENFEKAGTTLEKYKSAINKKEATKRVREATQNLAPIEEPAQQAKSEPQTPESTAITTTKAPQPSADRYQEATEAVSQAGKASTSMLQRRMKVGYSEAKQYIDRMKAEGLIDKDRAWQGPKEGQKGDIFDQVAQGDREQVQASTNPEEIRASAEAQKPAIDKMAQAAVAGVDGAQVEGSRVKDAESQANKEERGKPVETNIDNLGARVSAETPEALEQVKQNIEKNLPVVQKDKIYSNGLDVTQYGVKTGKEGEANQVSEIQVVSKPQAEAMKETDDLYDQQKKALAAGDQKKADELGRQITAKHEAAQSDGKVASILGSSETEGFWHGRHHVVDGQDRPNFEPEIQKLMAAGMSRQDAYDAVAKHGQDTGRALLDRVQHGDILVDSGGTRWRVDKQDGWLTALDDEGNETATLTGIGRPERVSKKTGKVLPETKPSKDAIAIAADSRLEQAAKPETTKPEPKSFPGTGKRTFDQHLWAETPRKGLQTASGDDYPNHVAWFDAEGIPSSGEKFDRIPRGFVTADHAEKKLTFKSSNNSEVPKQIVDQYKKQYPGYSVEMAPAANEVTAKPKAKPKNSIDDTLAVLRQVQGEDKGDIFDEVGKEAEPKYKHGSTQTNIPDDSEAAKSLETARQRISDSDLAGDGKDVGGNHVTVRYGLDGDVDKVRAFLEKQAPFEAKLGKTSKFEPSEHSDGAAVIVAPIEAPELHRINKEIQEHGQFAASSFPDYKPHATVAYVKPEKANRYVGMNVTEGKTFKVDSIAITDRNGKQEVVKLKGGAAPQEVKPAGPRVIVNYVKPDGTTATEKPETKELAGQTPNKEKFRIAYERHLKRVVDLYPEEYKAVPKDGIPALAKKMTESLAKGTANKDSRAIKATLKELGIKDTYKAIQEYLNTAPEKSEPAKPASETASTVLREDALRLDNIGVTARRAIANTPSSASIEITRLESALKSAREHYEKLTDASEDQRDRLKEAIGNAEKLVADFNTKPMSQVAANPSETVAEGSRKPSETVSKEPFSLEAPPPDIGVKQWIQELPRAQRGYAQKAWAYLEANGKEGLEGEIIPSDYGVTDDEAEEIDRHLVGILDREQAAKPAEKPAPPVETGSRIKEPDERELPTRTSGQAANVPSVPEPSREGGNPPETVPSKRNEAPRAERPTDVRAAAEDAGVLGSVERSPEERTKPDRSERTGDAAHPPAGRKGRRPERSGDVTTGADGEPVEAPTPEKVPEAQETAGKLRNSRNFRIEESQVDDIGSGGDKTKINANLDAIELLKKLEKEERIATPEEQAKLARYVDFGGLRKIWDQPWNFRDAQERLENLLSKQEIAAIKETSLNTHYTSIPVVDAIWKAAKRLGFESGRVLEPGMGIGNFFGRIPKALAARAHLMGVEKNIISGRMAQMLYPDAKIVIRPYEEVQLPNDSMDMIIGNPPFADIKIFDPLYKDPKLAVHNYFIVKSLDKLKPGGIAALVTSHYTLDAVDNRPRQEMFKRADLVAAIRLPNNAFKKNAGTEVTTDILFFRKRMPGEMESETPKFDEPWLNTTEIQVGKDTAVVNEYFKEHPEMVLGEHSLEGSMYRDKEYTVKAKEGDLGELLKSAVENLPRDVVGDQGITLPIGGYQGNPDAGFADPTNLAPLEVKNNAFYVDNGKVLIKQNGAGVELPPDLNKPMTVVHLKAAIALRDALKDTIRVQMESESEGELKASQKKLDRLYEDYRKKYGPLTGPKTARVFADDPEYPLLTALENVDPETKTVSKADIFSKRTARPYQPLRDLPADPKAAMLKVLAEKGKLDTKLMAKLLKKPEAEVVDALSKDNLIFRDPISGTQITADEYLSGNVRVKLKQAEAAAELDSEFDRNVKALKDVQPEPIKMVDIDARLGQTWIPTTFYQNFIHDALNGGGWTRDLPSIYRDHEGRWSVDLPNGYNRYELTHTWSGGDIAGHKLVEYALNQQQPTVYHPPDSDGKRELDAARTAAARAKLQEIKDKFSEWIKSDRLAKYHSELEEKYNDTFNGVRLRDYNGAHLDFPGLNPEFKPRPYQASVVWRIIQEGRALIDHFVGAGKTLSMMTAGMELRRMGLSRKNLYVVPNNMVPQWREDFKRAYPGANVLAVTDKDLSSAKNRRRLFSRIATNEWDAVIVPHSQFNMLPISPDREAMSLNKQKAELEEILDALKAKKGGDQADKRTLRQIENAKQKYEQRLKELSSGRKDNTIYFDDLGIDQLFIDEAHAYKALPFATKMGNISGLSTRRSQRAQNVLAKIEYMFDSHKGRGVVFATGTPITNTVGEQYLMTKYLAPDLLEKAGIRHFDDWAANFATAVTRMEYSTDGVTIKPKTSLSEYVNVPELQQLWSQFADVITQETAVKAGYLKLPKPKRIDKLVTVTPDQEPMLLQIAKRGEALMQKKGPPQKGEDNWLKLDTDSRDISLDARFYDPNAKDHPDSKANQAVGIIKDVLDRTKAERGTVLLVVDRYEARNGFNIFKDMKQKLVAQGVPANEIAIVHDFPKRDQFQAMQAAMRAGKIRVLLGTTEKTGVGLNIQNKLKALIHLDLPQRPDQVTQREGRIIRHGNQFDDVEIYRLISEPRSINSPKAHDLQRAQLLERKQTFLTQFKEGGRMGRRIDDVAGDVKLNPQMFAIAKAEATGNPKAIEKIKLEHEIKSISLLNRAYVLERHRNAQELERARMLKASLETILPQVQEAKALFDKNEVRDADGKLVSMKLKFNGREFDKLKDANEYLKANPELKNGQVIEINGVKIPIEVTEDRRQTYPVQYKFAGDWHGIGWSEGSGGIPGAQSVVSSALARARGLEAKIKEVEDRIQSSAGHIAKLEKELEKKSPYEAKLKDYETKLAEVEAELLKGVKSDEDLVDANASEPDEVTEDEDASEGNNEPVPEGETALGQPERTDRNQPAPGEGDTDELRPGRGSEDTGEAVAGQEGGNEPSPKDIPDEKDVSDQDIVDFVEEFMPPEVESVADLKRGFNEIAKQKFTPEQMSDPELGEEIRAYSDPAVQSALVEVMEAAQKGDKPGAIKAGRKLYTEVKRVASKPKDEGMKPGGRVVPGARSASTGNETGQTSLGALTDSIRRQAPKKASLKERMGLGEKVGEELGTNPLGRAWGRIKGGTAALWEAYKNPRPTSILPPEGKDVSPYLKAIGRWRYADQRSANDIRQFRIANEKAIPDKDVRRAMTVYIQADGDEDVIRGWIDDLKAESDHTRAHVKAFEDALKLTEEQKTVARNTAIRNESTAQEMIDNELIRSAKENYMRQIWKRSSLASARMRAEANFASLVTNPSITKKSVFSSYFDGIMAGFTPQDMDFAFLTATHERSLREALAARLLIKELLDLKATTDGRPLAVASQASARVVEGKDEEDPGAILITPNVRPGEEYGDYRIVDHPSLRGWRWANEVDGKPVFVKGDVLVHPDIYRHLKNVLGSSAIRNYTVEVGSHVWAPGAAVLRANSAAKQAILSLIPSRFHRTALETHAAEHRTNPWNLKELDFDNPDQKKLIENGLQVAEYEGQEAWTDGLGNSSELIKNIPLYGKWAQAHSDALFKDFIPRLKMSTALNALARNRERYKGEFSDAKIAQITAKQMNAAFGGINYGYIGRNKTLQDVLRLTILAPDFLEARAKFVAQAARPQGAEQLHALLLGAVVAYAAFRILNRFMDGAEHWDDPFALHYGGKRYEWRMVQGDLLNFIESPSQFAKNRFSPLLNLFGKEDKYVPKHETEMEKAKRLALRNAPIPVQPWLRKSHDTNAQKSAETILKLVGVNVSKERPNETPIKKIEQNLGIGKQPNPTR